MLVQRVSPPMRRRSAALGKELALAVFTLLAGVEARHRALVQRALTKFRLPYITVTPTFSICPTHGYLQGEHAFCPKCDEERLARKRAALAA